MEFSWWLVLLAVFAGWCIGYEKVRHSLTNFSKLLTRSGRTDLSTLLPDHNDQVGGDLELNHFLEQYAVDENSVELYLTLGDAFRRRGEYSRAIGVHQHLLSVGNLTDDQARRAKLELARDYASAGLLDRVETLLEPLVEADPNDGAAQASLLRVYEKQRDWQSAIELASAGTSLEQYPDAISYFWQIEQHHPELVPEIAESYFKALNESGDRDALNNHLDYVRGRQNSYTVVKHARDAICEIEGEQKASEFFIEQLAKRPSLRGLRDWAEYELELTRQSDRAKVQPIVEMLRGVTEQKPTYLCDRCGYRCNEIQWQCPGCENWNSVKVIIGAEGE